jgi:hypothetical protein
MIRNIPSRGVCEYRRGLECWPDSLITLPLDTEPQAITAPSLISTIHKSTQHPLNLFQPPVPSPTVSWQRFLTVDILQLRALTQFPAGHSLTTELGQSHSQSYFTTDDLPPISSSWRQAPWDSPPENFIFLQLHPCGRSLYVTPQHPLWWEGVFVSYEYASPLSSVRIAHTASYWKLFLLHYIHAQVLCQSKIWKADHDNLTYLILQRQLSHLNGRKLDYRQV